MLCFAGREGLSSGSKEVSTKKLYLHCQVVPGDASQAASSSGSDRSDQAEEVPAPGTNLAAGAIPEETPTPFQQQAAGSVQDADVASPANAGMSPQKEQLQRALLLGGAALLLLLTGHWLSLVVSSRSVVLGSIVMIVFSLAILAGAWAAYTTGWLEQKLPSAAHIAGAAPKHPLSLCNETTS